jgi:uncharacterized protein (DUF488 family)
VLDPGYVTGYVHEILDRADLDALVAQMPADRSTALLCVEADPEACHRSLLAERLAERHGLPVAHVRPRRAAAQAATAAPISERR